MGHFYFDESIRDDGKFILGALVYVDSDPTERLFSILRSNGMNPPKDEFKSHLLVSSDDRLSAIRKAYYCELRSARIALSLTPLNERSNIAKDAIKLIEIIMKTSELGNAEHSVHFDGGINMPGKHLGVARLDLKFATDSRVVPGIQLADLCANVCSTIVMSDMGLKKKSVKAGPNSGYDPEMAINLEFELWARLRYSFFHGEAISMDDNATVEEMCTVPMNGYGIYVNPNCSIQVKKAVDKRFRNLWLGCIH
jgi:Protein of unknown function (DUF3800)